jgi:hypothetical protein
VTLDASRFEQWLDVFDEFHRAIGRRRKLRRLLRRESCRGRETAAKEEKWGGKKSDHLIDQMNTHLGSLANAAPFLEFCQNLLEFTESSGFPVPQPTLNQRRPNGTIAGFSS